MISPHLARKDLTAALKDDGGRAAIDAASMRYAPTNRFRFAGRPREEPARCANGGSSRLPP
jgi:hypothetical protein